MVTFLSKTNSSLNSSSKVHEWPESAGKFLCRYAFPHWRAHNPNKQKQNQRTTQKTKLALKAEETLLYTVPLALKFKLSYTGLPQLDL